MNKKYILFYTSIFNFNSKEVSKKLNQSIIIGTTVGIFTVAIAYAGASLILDEYEKAIKKEERIALKTSKLMEKGKRKKESTEEETIKQQKNQ
jgi:H+/gluconate symporter-like permease